MNYACYIFSYVARGSNVAFGSLRPFGPGSYVARGSRTRGSNLAFGSLRPFGPGSKDARVSRTLGSNVGSLTNQEIMSHLYNTLWDNCHTRYEDRRFECALRLPKALRAWIECRTRFEDTRFECGSITNQEIMSHLYIHFGQLSHAVRMWPSAP